jgi:signal transduction histidine kinase
MRDPTRVRSLAAALRAGQDEVTRRWLERIAARVALDRQFLFPSEDLLDEVPLLIHGIAEHVAENTDIMVDAPVAAKARELGRMRFTQGFAAHQILWEYELLGALILQYLEDVDPLAPADLPGDFVRALLHALMVIQRATMEEYLAHANAQVREREERLRGFSRALSHELRNDISAVLSAGRMLQERFVIEDEALRQRFIAMTLNNGERIEQLLSNLLELARIDMDSRRNRYVLVGHAAAEAARQLRSFADRQNVRIEIDPALPPIEVNAAALDLALTNLIGNAIKYHRTDATDRWVRVQSAPSAHPHELTLEISDNGRGIPEEDRPQLFERLFRSASTSDVEGTGIGLSLVRDAIERAGGRIWADFPESGETIFALTLPARRADDVAVSS